MAYRVESIEADEGGKGGVRRGSAVVSHLGRDDRFLLQPGQWVEYESEDLV